MMTRLQAALARREQLEKVKEHLLKLDQQLERTKSALHTINLKVEKQASKINRFFSSIGKSLTKENKTKQSLKEQKHQLLLDQHLLEKEIKLLSFERSVLEEQLQELPVIQRTVDHLKHAKEQQLLHCSSWLGTTIRINNQQQEDLYTLRQSLQKVIISGSRTAAQLLGLANMVQKLADSGGIYNEVYHIDQQQVFSSYDYLERIRKKAKVVGELVLKYDADIFELYRVHRLQLPEAPERFFKYGPTYFTSSVYKGELKQEMGAVYLDFFELWRRITASLNRFKTKINQVEYQITYLEQKKDRLLEEV